ncbi:hypothetical protein K239x_06660 [Planctomycetes bacterium K23_9]|uniref:Prenyltransferase and squalene oxidase repeat protein n=2 Tax=Stieleria marina TaxID=1930275 RepID=A0A517NNN6_9BACT|nr:hypothetical protein K239x_06660 [Planctomycetes bacterium K23_9]
MIRGRYQPSPHQRECETTSYRHQAKRSFKFVLIAILGSVLAIPSRSHGYTPDDPVVRKMVSGGIKFLEEYKTTRDNPDGELVLLAYAHFKVEHDQQAPIVAKGLSAAKKIVQKAAAGNFHSHQANYEVAISVLLFATVNPQAYKAELESLQRHLMHVQSPNGAFTYHNEKLGDISQTQYALLAIWTLDRAGIPMDYAKVISALQWLLRVQDPGGGWPYHATDPGPGRPLQRQKAPYMSMALAGGSSILIAGDALRLWGDTSSDDDPGIVGLPKAIKVFKEDANKDRRRRVKISKEPIFRSVQMLEAWRAKNPYKRGAMLDWYYYQLYTKERYESFIEIANGRPKDKSPSWYNQGVDELKKYQDAGGGWKDRSKSAGHISTCFAILFLIRSTQKAIFSMGEGGAIGGQGFSDDVSGAKLVGGKAQTKKPAQAVSDMLDLLDGEDGELDVRAMAEAMELPSESEKPKDRASQLDRLERMVRGSRQWQARRVAAIVLGKSDEMRSVPALIYALSDPDKSVRRYARDGLRMISRKFEGYGMSDDPDYAELSKVQSSWRDWYRSMDPSYVFLDDDL